MYKFDDELFETPLLNNQVVICLLPGLNPLDYIYKKIYTHVVTRIILAEK